MLYFAGYFVLSLVMSVLLCLYGAYRQSKKDVPQKIGPIDFYWVLALWPIFLIAIIGDRVHKGIGKWLNSIQED